MRETLIESMDKDEVLAAVDDLDADELAELADDLPHQVALRSLADARRGRTRHTVKAAMSYEDATKSVRLWTSELVSIRADVASEAVLRHPRRFDSLPDHTDKILWSMKTTYCKAVLPHPQTFWSPIPKIWWKTLMAKDVVRFRAEDDVEEAAQAFER